MLRIALAALALSLAAATAVWAEPCEGRLPTRPGEAFAGTVRYVGDGDSLCVGRTSDPADWIEVRLADFDAPELRERDGRRAREVLSSVALGRQVTCAATPGRTGRVISHDRIIATCRLGGQRLGDQLRSRRSPEGGN
jgi:endonuclease YncB( thermonuclease family)